MKKAIISIILLVSAANIISGQESNLTINGSISPEVVLHRRTIYLFALTGNEYTLVDSCRIEPHDGTFSIRGYIPESDMLGYLVLPPKSYNLRLNPGDRISLTIDNDTPAFPIVEGSELSNERAYDMIKAQNLRKKYRELENNIAEEGITQEQKEILTAELSNLQYELDTGRHLDFISLTRNPSLYLSRLSVLSGKADGRKRVDDAVIDSLVLVMKERFPDDKKVQMYPRTITAPPSSEQSKSAYELMKSLTTGFAKTLSYKMGDRVREEDALKSMKEIDTNYILIDFWAKWCSPCMKEMPRLKEDAMKYGDELTVLAISLDHNEEIWRKTIEMEGIWMFKHIYVGNNNIESTTLLKQFGVTGIPANFLLDKDRRIIAMNLRGEALEEKMKEFVEDSDQSL